MTPRRALLAALLAAGCINEDLELYEVTLSGTVSRAGVIVEPGEVHLELHHARSGAGKFETPLGRIDATIEPKLGAVEWLTFVPLGEGEGEGLVLYGWLDLDGDGVLCAPGAAPEPAGAVELSGFPDHTIDFSLTLDTDCADSSALYPP